MELNRPPSDRNGPTASKTSFTVLNQSDWFQVLNQLDEGVQFSMVLRNLDGNW